MRILVADDDPVLHAIVSAVLEPEGYQIVSAQDGREALEAFERAIPDLVLTDFRMPGLNGIELCRAIQARKGRRLVPIIMFTGAAHPTLLKESLEAGAVEFLTKPFEPEELRVRVRAILELTRLHRDLLAEKARRDEELSVVKHVLERLLVPGHRMMPPSFHMETLATQRISGDACVYGTGIPGVHYGMICDATGHGLMAGVSTIPVVETFLSMVRKDIGLERIFAETNAKLRRMMPTGRFACLLLFRLDTNRGLLSVLNAGMPEARLFRQGRAVRVFPSQSLPAGVIETTDEFLKADTCEIQTHDRFLAFSDGLLETLEHLGQFDGFLDQASHASQAELQAILSRNVVDGERHDDISWAIWDVPPFLLNSPLPSAPDPGDPALLTGVRVRFDLDPRHEDGRDLLPQIQSLAGSFGVPEETCQILALLLTEALVNAIDHGMLGLESDAKVTLGFEGYQALRRSRLEGLEGGTVGLGLEFRMEPSGGKVRQIRATIEDSGSGFDWKTRMLPNESKEALPFGRGLSLIQALAGELAFSEKGNRLTFGLTCP